MNKYLILIRLSLFIALLAAGCRPAVQTDYRKTLPENSTVLAAVHAGRLIEKSGETGKQLLENLRQGAPGNEFEKILGSLLENRDIYGLDLEKHLYLFASETEQIAGGVAAVSDPARLQEGFLRMEREGVAGSLTEKNGTRRILLKNGLLCVFTEQLLFCVTGKDEQTLQKYADKQLSGKQREKEVQPGYPEFMADTNDVCVWFLGNRWPAFTAGMPQQGIDLSKVAILLRLCFEKGKATATYEYFTADAQTKESLAQYSAFLRPVTNRFLTRYPADLLSYQTVNLEGRQLYELLNQWGVWKGANLKTEEQQLLQQVLSSLDGDISLGVTGVMPMGIPVVLLYAECPNADAFEQLKMWGERQFYQVAELSKTGAHQYEMKVFMLNMTVWFGWKNGMAYLTNSPEWYRNLDKATAVSLAQSPLTSGWGQPAAGWMLNIAGLMELPMVQLFVYQKIPPQNMDEFKQLIAPFSHLDIVSEKSGKTVWNVYLKEKEQNSLPLFLELGRLAAGIF
ncbi:MAG: DUF4836 family protein [Culturomica sp.]|jgi:hypothetical protein|nr:DUF4836 family protein [Culturomica sp.]